MAAGPVTLALAALLLPALSFLVIGVLPPLRRSGRPAALFSIACALAAFRSRVLAWRAAAAAGIETHAAWPWLPGAHGPLATVGVLVDSQSTTMLLLVTLVALLVQVYSLGYLSDEPAPALGRYYAFQSLFAFSMMGVVLAPNLLQLFVCWELVGVCSLPADRILVSQTGGGARRAQGVLDDEGRRRRAAGRHRPAAARDRDVRPRRAAARWPRAA